MLLFSTVSATQVSNILSPDSGENSWPYTGNWPKSGGWTFLGRWVLFHETIVCDHLPWTWRTCWYRNGLSPCSPPGRERTPAGLQMQEMWRHRISPSPPEWIIMCKSSVKLLAWEWTWHHNKLDIGTHNYTSTYVQGKLLFGSKGNQCYANITMPTLPCQYCPKQDGNPRQPAFKANALCQLSYLSNTDGGV